jgi:pilus assembly protein FimV
MRAALPAMSRYRTLLWLLAGLWAPAVASAADLGPLRLTSPAGEPLQGLVSIFLATEEMAEDLNVAVGSPAEYGWLEIPRPPWVDEVEVHVALEEEGGAKVRIWTGEPPPDRQFSLLLVLSSPNGRSLRQYDVVLRDAEVLLAPAAPEARPAKELPAKPPAKSGVDPVADPAAQLPVARPARRALSVPDRGEPQVRRNLTISSAGNRPGDAALERRAQRLEESAAAQLRALNEANARITELQGQIEKLERLLALKGASALPAQAAPTADAVSKAAADAKPAGPAAPAPAEAQAPTPAEAAVPAESAAQAPAPASAAAPMEEVDAAESQPAEAAAEAKGATPAEAQGSAPAAEDTEHEEGVGGLLLMVGGVLLALALATLGAMWWRRRAKRAQLAAATEAADATEAVPEDIGAPAEAAAPEAPAPPSSDAADAVGAVDAQIAAALDAPLGDVGPAEAPPPATTPVADLDALTAEPAPADVDDTLDTLFSEEAIAAAQTAIQTAAGAAPASAEVDAEPPAAPAAVAAVETPAPPVEEAEPEPAEDDEVDAAADLEDVEVNLAKAYIDMGDPEGARAILESMLSDPDDPQRAALARRTMRRFGLRPSAPPAASAAAEG